MWACGLFCHTTITDRYKEKILLVRQTCKDVRWTCPPTFPIVKKIMQRSKQNYKFRKKTKHNNKTKSAASIYCLKYTIA